MRVGPYGILQPVADAVKLMIKEDITPVRADKWVFTAAPIISMVPALIVYAVIPFDPWSTCSAAGVAVHHRCQRRPALRRSVASVGVYGSSWRATPPAANAPAREPARVGTAHQLWSR
jgi:NADH:ubiquinone oxidoreductase subunit H